MRAKWNLILFLFAVALFIGLATWRIRSAPQNPSAIIQVIDATGKPVVGANVTPRGLRTKSGPFSADWYDWSPLRGVPNDPVVTDANGYARVPYPQFVFERIETGVVIVSVNHKDFVPNSTECVVSVTPPAGAPLRIWANYFFDRIAHKLAVSQTSPITLQKGATLTVSLNRNSIAPRTGHFCVQTSAKNDVDADSWIQTEPGFLTTHRLPAGNLIVRLVEIQSTNKVWFSDVTNISAVVGQTNQVEVDIMIGASVHGQLDSTVPRPVSNGRIVAEVCPAGIHRRNNPPTWHAWSQIREDGTFDFPSLPRGDLELVALCNGFVSTNGPGKAKFVYPQAFQLNTNSLSVVIGMEPTARLEVQVNDDKGKPVTGAEIAVWPNVRYGDWAARILLGDCWNTSDLILSSAEDRVGFYKKSANSDFSGMTDSNGLVVLRNLPILTSFFAVENSNLCLPVLKTGSGRQERNVMISLMPGETKKMTVQLEPKGKSQISHY